MKKTTWMVASACLVLAVAGGGYAWFQHTANQSYAGLEKREIKALSESEIAGLQEGKGLGYALAAELNGYPGPRHVLDFSKDLALSDAQHVKTEQLFAQMKAEASPLGLQLIEAERNLDAFFTTGKKDTDTLKALTQEAARIDGTLRATHLKYHIAMLDILHPQQIGIYKSKRGYGARAHSTH